MPGGPVRESVDSDGVRNEDREIMEEQKRAVMASTMEANYDPMAKNKPFPEMPSP